VFHATLAAAADLIVGRVHRGAPSYALVYRSIDHKALRTTCDVAQRPVVPEQYRRFVPSEGFSDHLQIFAKALIALQERRTAADYDPIGQVRTAHASQAIEIARTALRHWDAAPEPDRRAFLMLLLFPPR
jgi:hypothetical protein